MILFVLCFNFISIYYHTQEQKKNKNYLGWKIDYNIYAVVQFCFDNASKEKKYTLNRTLINGVRDLRGLSLLKKMVK